MRPIAIAVHGGAGPLALGALSAEAETQAYAALEQALRAGHEVLRAGGSSLDAVVRSVVVLEDCPLFNAGHGSVLTHAGHVEMDAALMSGKDRRAGAAACVRTIKNPIRLAQAVMLDGTHVFLSGAGAEAFAQGSGVELADPSYFVTEPRRQQWQRLLESESRIGAVPAEFGTVGAVALDAAGDLAAGTSTGGMANKRWGRIGDSPVVGAGTYADNRSAAVSATGNGELFLRAAAAHDVCARMAYGGQSLEDAASGVLVDEVLRLGGEGGLIAIDGTGRIVQRHTTSAMYRGSIDATGNLSTAIYADP